MMHDATSGRWRYTCRRTGRRLTHEPSGYYVPVDCLEIRQDPKLVTLAIEHAERKPGVTPEDIRALQDAFRQLRLFRFGNSPRAGMGRAA